MYEYLNLGTDASLISIIMEFLGCAFVAAVSIFWIKCVCWFLKNVGGHPAQKQSSDDSPIMINVTFTIFILFFCSATVVSLFTAVVFSFRSMILLLQLIVKFIA